MSVRQEKRKDRSPASSSPDSDGDVGRQPFPSLPRAGGALRGIDEKFNVHPLSGTGSLAVPIPTSPGRSGSGPALSLSYDSGFGQGPWGLGWRVPIPSVSRKTEKGVPLYQDGDESDTFIISGAEDLVPSLNETPGGWVPDRADRSEGGIAYAVRRFRPRVESDFTRIERWIRVSDGDVHWRSISPLNVTTIYGKTPAARIADVRDPRKVFEWLIEETRNDKGHVTAYEYKEEDAENVLALLPAERNRLKAGAFPQKYIKHIFYGNRTSFAAGNWLFEVVFDYGDHNRDAPAPTPDQPWPGRPDPISTHRPGFDLRTYRLCRRVLMFHRFAELSAAPCLVHSTDFTYREDPAVTQLTAVTQIGYVRRPAGGYDKQSFPPLSFTYVEPQIQEEVRILDGDSAENLPRGLGGPYVWVDLEGEGLQGVITEQGREWWYKENLGGARLGPARLVGTKPTTATLGRNTLLLDLGGNGRLDLVTLAEDFPGLFERNAAGHWDSFKPFTCRPAIDWSDPNTRLIDLTGDGRADVLITTDEALLWHPSAGEAGFGPPHAVVKATDEEKGPALVLADRTQMIFLADMDGDGLMDLVRIKNGEVCYWPNQGHGRFGAKVTMANAPVLDAPDFYGDRFGPDRVRLADVAGTGVPDILYLGADGGITLWTNQAGNGWSAPRKLAVFPGTDRLSDVRVADILGQGTACLVWSSPAPRDGRRALQYVDLMGGIKPHLLETIVNNTGRETRLRYASSTKFYLADKAAGRRWPTQLPFPVAVVESIETRDLVTRTRFTCRYTYHDGFYDGAEREFRGFGFVEQVDAESFEDYVVGVKRLEGSQELDPAFYQPPVTTRSWHHTGAALEADRVHDRQRDEFYLGRQHVPDPFLPVDLDGTEWRDTLRALKGRPLRQEIYGFDGSPQENVPYSTVENAYEVRRLQPGRDGKPAVFHAFGREALAFHYDRKADDPRVTHGFSLEVGPRGQLRKSCSVVYGRRTTDPTLPAEVTRDQRRTVVTSEEILHTDDIDRLVPTQAYRLGVPYSTRAYEVTGASPTGSFFTFEEISAHVNAATQIPFDQVGAGPGLEKRLLARGATLFLDDALTPMAFGQWDTLGLAYESYRLAMPAGALGAAFDGKITGAKMQAAGYVHFNADADWWIPSGTVIYPANPGAHFYIPIGSRDPFGLETAVIRDAYDLLPERVLVTQAPWLQTTVANDYRLLRPVSVTDPNGNRSAVEMDALGHVIKSAVMGKAGAGEGDTLTSPTTRAQYDVFNWMNNRRPNFVRLFARERHQDAGTPWQQSVAYLDGGGTVVLGKARVHAGKAMRVLADGTAVEVDADPRWVANGRTVLNNKGTPVKQYEPYFSDNDLYEDEKAVRELGVTPLFTYDPLGRNVRTVYPDGTLSRIELHPWKQRSFDANDAVKESAWYVHRGSPNPDLEPEPIDPERRAAWLAARHGDTAAESHFDSLGRPVLAVFNHGGGITSTTRAEADLTGRWSSVIDQLGRLVASGRTGMAGPIGGETAERGRRWIFQNVLGAVVTIWEDQGREFRAVYDVLHRLVASYVREPGKAEILFSYQVYGDRLPDAVQRNMLGTPHLIFDQAGLIRIDRQDFKGNPLGADRILAKDHTNPIDWSALTAPGTVAGLMAAAAPSLEMTEVFTASAEGFDALNRPAKVTLPDGTRLFSTYKEGNFLASLKGQIRGQGALVPFLQEQDYDAKGQRRFARHGNDVITRYFYDPKNFRLTRLVACKSNRNPDTQALQDLRFTFDAAGNVVRLRDHAQRTHYFSNAVVEPEFLFEYDALYQLTRATGRELAGLLNDAVRTDADLPAAPLPHPNNTAAVRVYTEEYDYDLCGNIKEMRHRAQNAAGGAAGWTRRYLYTYETNAADRTNRLAASSVPGDPAGGLPGGTYSYDAWGNMTRMPHLADMVWDFLDRLRRVDLGGGGIVRHEYGADGGRVRKVVERNNTLFEWIYMGAVVIFRRRRRNTRALRFERWTTHVADNVSRIAQVDVKTRDDDNLDPANPIGATLIRYQYANHVGSASLETDPNGDPVSYEEYYPFGTTAYRSVRPGGDLSLKRYRFSGKERDDETGLYYFGARYQAPWLGRWTSTDPAGFVDGLNLYRYCGNNPVGHRDENGTHTARSFQFKLDEQGNYSLSVETQDYATGTGKLVTETGDLGTLKRLHDDLLKNSGIAASLTAQERESVFKELERFAQGLAAQPSANLPGELAPLRVKAAPPTPPPKPPPPPPPPSEPANPASDAPALAQSGPAAERFIWNYEFPGTGAWGTQRGRILEWMFGNAWRDNTANYDLELNDRVQQIKSTEVEDTARVRRIARNAAADAAEAIADNPTGTMAGKRPQAVVITPTDAPPSVEAGIKSTGATGTGTGPLPPEHVRGFPRGWGLASMGLIGVGTGLSGWALVNDVLHNDWSMAFPDTLGVVGGGLQIHAVAVPSAKVLGVSSMTAGLVLAGAGIAIGSGISSYRAFGRGDTLGGIVGLVGVGAGTSIAVGAIGVALGAAGATGAFVALAPVILGVGIVLALGVGAFHLYRWLASD